MPPDHGTTEAAPPPPGRLDSLDRTLSRRAAVDWPHPRWFTVPLGGLSLSANYGVLWYVLCLAPLLSGADDPLLKALYVAVPVTLVEMTGFVIKHFVGRVRPPLADPTQAEQIPLPLSSGKVQLSRSSPDELVVHIGNRKRVLSLPHTLAAMQIRDAYHREGTLSIEFRWDTQPEPSQEVSEP